MKSSESKKKKNRKEGQADNSAEAKKEIEQLQEQAEKLIGQIGKCDSSDALTMGDPCTICGQPKSTKEEQE